MIKGKKAECGGSVVDFILFVAVVVCAIFVVMMLIENNAEENIAIANNSGDGKASYSYENSINYNKNIENKLNNSTANTSNAEQNISLNNKINESNISYRRYFYNQLTDNEKDVYNQIYNKLDTLKTGIDPLSITYSGSDLDNFFQTIWDALMLDNPEIFYINTNNITLETRTESKIWGNIKYTYQIIPKSGTKYFSDSWGSKEELDEDIKNVDEIAYKVANEANNLKGSYNKAKYVHDYLVDNIDYDQIGGINSGNLYGALINRKAVCEGYSKALQYLLNILNIPNIIVYGSGTNNTGESEFHSWNYVQMENGNWYGVDTTWDDPIIIGNGKSNSEIKSKYFMKGSNLLFTSHFESGDVSGTGQNFKYIEISKEDY